MSYKHGVVPFPTAGSGDQSGRVGAGMLWGTGVPRRVFLTHTSELRRLPVVAASGVAGRAGAFPVGMAVSNPQTRQLIAQERN